MATVAMTFAYVKRVRSLESIMGDRSTGFVLSIGPEAGVLDLGAPGIGSGIFGVLTF